MSSPRVRDPCNTPGSHTKRFRGHCQASQWTMLMTCRYITSVSPVTDCLKVDTLRPVTQAAGSELAASLLAEHFALPKCTGVQQLCTEIAHFQTAEGSHQTLSFNSTAAETIPHDVASSLVAIVDQADAASSSSSDNLHQSLSPESFIPHITRQFILAVTTSNRHVTHSQTVSLSKTSSAGPDDVDGQDTQHQLAFMAEVIGRFCRRGHVGAVAKALWSHMLAVHEPKVKQQQHQQQQQAQQRSQAKLNDDARNQSQQQLQQQSQHQPHQEQELQQLPESQQQLQQQQQQQQQMPQQDQGCQTAPLEAPVAAVSEPLAAARQAVCCIIAAMQDAAALDKLLTALLQQTDAVGDTDNSNLEMMRCIVRPLWARGTVRQALSTIDCPLSTIYCLPSTVYHLLSAICCPLCTVCHLLFSTYRVRSTVHCLPSTVYCLLSAVYCLLSAPWSTFYCLLSTVSYPLSTIHCLLHYHLLSTVCQRGITWEDHAFC